MRLVQTAEHVFGADMRPPVRPCRWAAAGRSR